VGELGHVGLVEQVSIAPLGLLGAASRAGERHAAAPDVAHRRHPAGTEDLAADVVAVGGREARLGRTDRAVVEPDGHHRRVEQPVGLARRPHQRVGDRVDGRHRGTGVEVAQGVDVVDQGLEEDRPGRRVRRVGCPGGRVARERAQQVRGAECARVHQRPGVLPAPVEAPVEPHLQHHARLPAGSDRPVGVGQRQRHRLLDEDGLARLRRLNDQVGVRAGRRRDQDRFEVRVGQDRSRVGTCHGCAEAGGQPLGGAGCRVDDGGETGPRHPAREALAVEASDGARPDQSDRDRSGRGFRGSPLGGLPAVAHRGLEDAGTGRVKAERKRSSASVLSPEAHASSATVPP